MTYFNWEKRYGGLLPASMRASFYTSRWDTLKVETYGLER